MRVVTFNVFSGRTADGTWDEALFRAAIATLDADVLALQEVDHGQPRSGGADLTAIAAEATGAVDFRFLPALAGTPASWTPAQGTEPAGTPRYGVALLSRLRVTAWREVRIAAAPVPLPHRWERRLSWVRDEPRVAVVAEIDSPLGQVEVVGTHLSFLRPWNRWQLRRLLRDLGTPTRSRLLLGDLNMGPGPAVRITGLAPLVAAPTFPALRPREQIDHVLASRGIRATRCRAVHLPVSDHRALIVDL